jgi:hypothetical protein
MILSRPKPAFALFLGFLAILLPNAIVHIYEIKYDRNAIKVVYSPNDAPVSVSGWYGPGAWLAFMISLLLALWRTAIHAQSGRGDTWDADLLVCVVYSAVASVDLIMRSRRLPDVPDGAELPWDQVLPLAAAATAVHIIFGFSLLPFLIFAGRSLLYFLFDHPIPSWRALTTRRFRLWSAMLLSSFVGMASFEHGLRDKEFLAKREDNSMDPLKDYVSGDRFVPILVTNICLVGCLIEFALRFKHTLYKLKRTPFGFNRTPPTFNHTAMDLNILLIMRRSLVVIASATLMFKHAVHTHSCIRQRKVESRDSSFAIFEGGALFLRPTIIMDFFNEFFPFSPLYTATLLWLFLPMAGRMLSKRSSRETSIATAMLTCLPTMQFTFAMYFGWLLQALALVWIPGSTFFPHSGISLLELDQLGQLITVLFLQAVSTASWLRHRIHGLQHSAAEEIQEGDPSTSFALEDLQRLVQRQPDDWRSPRLPRR